MISINHVDVSFRGESVLHDISLDLPQGGFTSIVGPSGCGKSTLLRCVANLVQPTAGKVTIAGESSETAFVFQSPNLLPWRNVVQNISLPLELKNANTQERNSRVNECLELVGLLSQDREKLPGMLSGGMQMRVSLARALVTRPDVLLMDEPFAALDDILRQQLNEELLRLWDRQNWTSLFVTHNVAEAIFLGQRVVVVSSRPGRIASIIDVPFDYPRTASLRASAEFAELTGTVAEQLREAAQ